MKEENNVHEPTLNTTQEEESSTTPQEDELKAVLENYDNALPQDPIEAETGYKQGTTEHNFTGKLLSRVKENNSVKSILTTTRFMMVAGYLFMVINLFIKIVAAIFDIDYHMPLLKEVTGQSILFMLGLLIGIVVVIVNHLSADGIVNDKWKKIPRFVLALLFIVFMSASLYLDNRAIENYNTKLIELKKAKELQNKNSSSGVVFSAVQKQQKSIDKRKEQYEKRIATLSNRLDVIAKNKDEIQQDIRRYKSKKEHTKSYRTIKKLNSNIYTSRKQLTAYENEEERVNAQIEAQNRKIEELQKDVLSAVELQKGEIEKIDEKMAEEKAHRVMFAWVLLLLFELGSFMTVLAKFLENQSLEKELRRKKDNINNSISNEAVMMNHLNLLSSDILHTSERRLAQGRDALKAIQLSTNINQEHQVEAIGNTVATAIIANQAIKKIGSQKVVQHIKYLGNASSFVAQNGNILNINTLGAQKRDVVIIELLKFFGASNIRELREQLFDRGITLVRVNDDDVVVDDEFRAMFKGFKMEVL